MTPRLPISVDLRTSRLIKAAQGVLDARLMDVDAARIVVRTAKATRSFCESLDYDLADASLDAVLDVLKENDDTDERVLRSLRAHVSSVRKATKGSL